MSTRGSPTAAQLLVLQHLAAGRDPASHLNTRSDYGGFTTTWGALRRKGWISEGAPNGLTDAGRAAIAKATRSTP